MLKGYISPPLAPSHSVTTIFGSKDFGNEGKPRRQKVPKFLDSLEKMPLPVKQV